MNSKDVRVIIAIALIVLGIYLVYDGSRPQTTTYQGTYTVYGY